MSRRAARYALAAWSALALGGCAVLTPLPEPTTLDRRLAAFPTAAPGLAGPVTIHWHARAIPFIEADSDRDAFHALGLVHAHLRLGQMEMLRRISQGRIAEMAGPLAADIDRSVRLLGFGRASAAVIAAMPPAERALLDAFVAGINHYQATMREEPHEFAVAGLRREPWRAEEIITIGRLASTDVNWLVWLRLLPYRDRPDWPELFARLARDGAASVPSFDAEEADPNVAAVAAILASFSRSGSNSAAVAGRRSRSGAALIASDPHLGLNLPNTWLIAGMKSPSFHVLGLMVPGLPFVAVGRNPEIAWGGTNMRAASSDLIDLSDIPEDQLTVRREPLRMRWWPDGEAALRDSPVGPVLSDAPMVNGRPGERFALAWVGHRPTDELTAMLRVNRASSWPEFRAALAGFAISPQNFVYADRRGNIGQVTATMLPRRAKAPPADIVQPPAAARAWERLATSLDLPAIYNPAQGFVASANNKPVEAEIPIGWFFSSDDRILRLKQMLGGERRLAPEDLFAVQQDVLRISAVALRDLVMRRAAAVDLAARLDATGRDTLARLAAWDGRYAQGSAGAVAFEAVAFRLSAGIAAERDAAAVEAGGRTYEHLTKLIAELPDAQFAELAQTAVRQARASIDAFPDWGARHATELRHLFGNLPVIGGRWRFGSLPGEGGNETLNKAAHALTDERSRTRFGANARHVSDLGHPDRNWFVLFGGNDGWINSDAFIDQATELWPEGRYVELPLSLDGVRERFARRVVVAPGR